MSTAPSVEPESTWPIAAAMLQFPAQQPDGSRTTDAPAEVWADAFTRIRSTGFEYVEVNDNWVRVGDLTPRRQEELAQAARSAGIDARSLCVVRSSVIDPLDGATNLAYTHRSLEAAARMGMSIVSIGFHRPLLAAQRRALWFWTEPGAVDAPDDPDNWKLAVERVRELGLHAEELGLQLTLEMYEDTYLGTGDLAARFVTDVDLPGVGLNPDVGNLIRLHRPIDSWEETFHQVLPHTNYWHVKNYFRDEDPASGVITAIPAPMRLGLINYRAVVAEAISLGFRGMFVCEHYGGDGLGVSAENREYLETLLPATGKARR